MVEKGYRCSLAAALALGIFSAEQIDNQGKTISRQLVRQLIWKFSNNFSLLRCRELINRDLSEPAQYQALIEALFRETPASGSAGLSLFLGCVPSRKEDIWESKF